MDLPQPLGPTIPHLSLGSTRKFIDLSIWTPAPVDICKSVRRRLAPFVSPFVTPKLAEGAADVAVVVDDNVVCCHRIQHGASLRVPIVAMHDGTFGRRLNAENAHTSLAMKRRASSATKKLVIATAGEKNIQEE